MENIVVQVTSSYEDTDTATECSDYSGTESADEVYKVISGKFIACADLFCIVKCTCCIMK